MNTSVRSMITTIGGSIERRAASWATWLPVRRRPVPVPPHELPVVNERVIEFFLSTRLISLNRRPAHWAMSSRIARKQRDAVAQVVLVTLGRKWHLKAAASRPKRVVFTAYLARLMDDDNLRGAIKAARDGLVDSGLLHDDGPTSGHEFIYTQTPGTARQHRGLRIAVSLK